MRRPATEAMLTTAPPPRCLHMRDDRLRAVERPAQIDRDDPVPIGDRHRRDGLAGDRPGRVDQDVDAALLRRDVGGEAGEGRPSATSRACPFAVANSAPISAATRSAAAPSRSITATRAPAAAKARQEAWPMPLPPPVTRTIFPAKSNVIGLPPMLCASPAGHQHRKLDEGRRRRAVMDRVGGDADRRFAILGQHRVAAVGVAGAAREVAAGDVDLDPAAGAKVWWMSPRSIVTR